MRHLAHESVVIAYEKNNPPSVRIVALKVITLVTLVTFVTFDTFDTPGSTRRASSFHLYNSHLRQCGITPTSGTGIAL
jgi:hypothetical protein